MIYGSYNNCCYPYNISDCYNIKVEGNGSVIIDPDLATITFGIITEDEDLQKAQIENQQRANTVLKALMGIGIKRDDIQTIDYRVEKIYEYIEGERVFKGYKVINRFRVTVRDVENVGEVIDVAVNNGANEVSNISFSLSQPNIHYRKALSMAVSNAVTKALQIGRTLGVKVNPTPLRLIEESYESDYIPRQPTYRAPEEETPILPQDVIIKAKVLAEFVYVKTRQY